MKRHFPILLTLGIVVLVQITASGGRAHATSSADQPARVSFRRDVAPVLSTSCSTRSCHGGGSRPPVLTARAEDAAKIRAALVGVPSDQRPERSYVMPGAPDASYLMQKIEGHLNDAECIDHDCGSAMPLDNPSLSIEARQAIRAWIAQGAQDN